jgi:hypothetical protein
MAPNPLGLRTADLPDIDSPIEHSPRVAVVRGHRGIGTTQVLQVVARRLASRSWRWRKTAKRRHMAVDRDLLGA